MFLRKHLEEGVYQVSAVSASDVLKRNTDSLRCAVENDVFTSLTQDSLFMFPSVSIRFLFRDIWNLKSSIHR